MSKLNFSSSIDLMSDEEEGDSKPRPETEKSARKQGDSTSFQLFDLTHEEDDAEEAKSVPQLSSSGNSVQDAVPLSSDSSTKLVEAIETIPVVNVQLQKPQSSSQQVSSWLGRFLGTKRSVIDPETLVPPLEVSNDVYLEQFAKTYNDLESPVEPIDGAEEEEEVGTRLFKDGVVHLNESGVDQDLSVFVDPLDLMEAQENAASAAASTVTINLFNLPYTADIGHVSEYVTQGGVDYKSIDMGGETANSTATSTTTTPAKRSTTLPAGAAAVIVLIPEGKTADDCIQALHGRSMKGRIIRAQKAFSLETRRRMSSGGGLGGGGSIGRYFERDISTKCHNCGQVGHRMQECTNSTVNQPCHLCAGTDHDPGDCPNLLCYRCGRFGHHSRDCRNSSGARPLLCYQCGSIDHNLRDCPDYDPRRRQSQSRNHHNTNRSSRQGYDSLIESSSVQCLQCRRPGHLLCGPNNVNNAMNAYLDQVSNNNRHAGHSRSGEEDRNAIPDIYCPNCGEQGHHIDFVAASDRTRRLQERQGQVCVVPRCEAFFKFQQLQRDYEGLLPPPPTATSTATSAFTRDLLDCEDNALAYYRNVARSQFDFSLFPILQMTTQERSLRRQRLVAEARSKSTNGDKNNSGGKASNNSGDDQKNTNVNNTGDEANGSKKTVTMTKGRAVFIAEDTVGGEGMLGRKRSRAQQEDAVDDYDDDGAEESEGEDVDAEDVDMDEDDEVYYEDEDYSGVEDEDEDIDHEEDGSEEDGPATTRPTHHRKHAMRSSTTRFLNGNNHNNNNNNNNNNASGGKNRNNKRKQQRANEQPKQKRRRVSTGGGNNSRRHSEGGGRGGERGGARGEEDRGRERFRAPAGQQRGHSMPASVDRNWQRIQQQQQAQRASSSWQQGLAQHQRQHTQQQRSQHHHHQQRRR